MFRQFERNVRVSDKVLGDVRSLVAACVVGEREMNKLIDRHGSAEFENYCGDLMDYTERGRFRGGLALERHLRFKTSNATLQIRSDRRDHPPYGLQGGQCGAPSNVSIVRADGTDEACRAKFLTTVHRGDILRVRLAGGGGHGEASQRDVAAVLRDVIEEKMLVAHARDA